MTDRMLELIELLNRYKHEYYNLNKPSTPDYMFDRLYDELVNLEKETGLILSNSPTQNVGYEVKSKLKKVAHDIPLLSLDKTKSIEDVKKFVNDKEYIVMTKADGLTVKLIYENGKLIQGSTRGNGEIGEDITHNVLTFKGVPLEIPYKEKLVVVGEAIIHKKDFEKINAKLTEEDKYKTPRNLVSGSVRQLDSKICSERMVQFYTFNVLEGMDDIDSKYERFNKLARFGFWIIIHTNKLKNETLEFLQKIIDGVIESSEELSLPIDGLVFTYDSVSYSNSLKSTSHHPLHSYAFKLEDELAETTLAGIEWRVGRTSQITPVALFDTVILDGTEINRASLHNLSIIEELELGFGDTITVYKANMIIPQIQDNLTRTNNLIIPKECPSCSGETIIEQLNDSKVLKCTNVNCPAKLIGKLSHFASRDAMNIEGLSEATLEKFIEKGFIKTYSDIYNLEQYKNIIVNMDSFGKRSYDKLISAIEQSKNTEMYRLVYGLGIPNVGKSSSKIIAKYFENDIVKFIENVANFDFTILEDFGNTTNESIHNWANEINLIEIKAIVKHLNIKLNVLKQATGSQFFGKTFVVTGSLKNYTRTTIQEKLESLGVNISGSVSKKTDYVLVGEDAGSKLTKAQNLGIKILSEEEFEGMIKT